MCYKTEYKIDLCSPSLLPNIQCSPFFRNQIHLQSTFSNMKLAGIQVQQQFQFIHTHKNNIEFRYMFNTLQ